MWWEFKLILSAIAVLITAAIALHRYTEENNRIFKRIFLTCLIVILFSVLWLIWGPSHDIPWKDLVEKP